MEIVNVKYLHANITSHKLQEPSVKRDNTTTYVIVIDATGIS
jgi:hypothetical protein